MRLEDVAWVRALARSLAADAHLADDIAQDTLIAAWTHARDGGAPSRGWLAQVARNFLRQSARLSRHRSERDSAAARSERLPPADDALAQLESQRRLMAAVAELDEAQRTVVVLRYVEGLPPRAIAARLGCSAKTVSHRLGNALRQLRARLEREGGREGWFAAVAPLLARDPQPIPWPLGVTLVNVKLVVSALFVILGAAAWVWWPAEPARPSEFASAPATQVGASERVRRALPAESERSASDEARRLATSSAAELANAATLAHPAAVSRRIEGQVFSADGAAIGGIAVAQEGGAQRVLSANGGWFAFDTFDEAGRIESVDERWLTVAAGEFSASSSVTPIVIVAESIALAGEVLDAGGHELAGARVSLLRPLDFDSRFAVDLHSAHELGFAASSDERGRFEFARAPSMVGARLRVVLDGFEPFETAAPTQDTRNLSIVLARPRVASSGRLSGVVLTPEREPARKARVSIGLTAALCDDEGRFELDLSRAVTTDELRAVKEGFLPALMQRPYEPRGDTGWPSHVELVLPGRALALAGVVVDHENEPIAGARVCLADPTHFGVIGRMPASLEALASGAAVPPEALASLRDMPESDGEHFWDYYTQPGPPSALWNYVRTDAQGRFELGGLAPREYRLEVQRERVLERFVSAPVVAGDRAVRIEMPPPERWEVLSGVVVGPDDEPIANASLQLELEMFSTRARVFGGSVYVTLRDSGAHTKTDEHGRFEFKDAPRGPVNITIRGDALVPSEHALDAAVDPLRVRLVADPRCAFELELAPPLDRADALEARDGEGRALDLLRIRGGSINAYTAIPLSAGRSGVHSVSSRVRTLVLTKNGAEVGRLEVRLRGGAPVTLRW